MTQIEMTPSQRIENGRKDLEQLFANVDARKAEGKTYGYAGLPHILDTVREFGIDKVFFVSEDYHGMYEDDYCTFTYWNEVTKELETDGWTTAAACPAFDLYEMPILFRDAWTEGLIDKKAFEEFRKSQGLEQVDRMIDFKFKCDELDDKTGLRVKVERGAKWKGTGLFLGYTESRFQYAVPRYRNHSSDYGVNVTRTANVLDEETKEICQCNADYMQFVDMDEILESYRSWAKQIISNASIQQDSNFREMPDLVCSTDFSEFLKIWKSAHSNDIEACNNAIEEFKAKKMEELVVWVTEKTDKKGDDIKSLSEHIFAKRYAWAVR